MSKPFKVDEVLKDHAEDREALEAFARDPGRTIDECWKWLTERGYVLSRTAVFRWKREFDAQVAGEQMRGSGLVAREFLAAAKESGGLAIPDAAVLRVSTGIFERMAELESRGEVQTSELTQLALGLQRLMLAKARLEATRTEFEERERNALVEADKAVAAGADGKSVVAKFREHLNMPPLPAPANGGAA